MTSNHPLRPAGCLGASPETAIPTELVARLEATSAGSRGLDAAITAHLNGALLKPYPPATDFGPSAKWQFWSLDGAHFLGNESKFPVPPFTTSLDAALALAERVLPGWLWNLAAETYGCDAELFSPRGECWDGHGPATGATPALALCIAILRATTASSVGTSNASAPNTPDKEGEQ